MSKKILVIEDNKDYSDLLQKVLVKAGFDVTVFNDDQNILERVKSLSPDLILLDIMLPHTSGLSILEEIKKNDVTKGVPIFCLTNLPEEIGREKAIALGAYSYLTKVHYSIFDVTKHVELYFKEKG